MEYSKDRLNKQIRDLVRENGHLKDSLFRKDLELRDTTRRLGDEISTTTFLGIAFTVTIAAFILFALYAVKLASGA
jgi:hypothetical protein